MSRAESQQPAAGLPALVDGTGPAAVQADRTAAEEAARRAVQRLFTATAALAIAWVLIWGAAGAWLARSAWPAAEFAAVAGAALGLVVAVAWLVIGNAGMARSWVRGDGSALATWTGADALSTGFDRLAPGSMGPLDPSDAAWVDQVRDVAQQLGLARPKVYVWSHEPSINALVAGWTPSTTALVVTRGALDKLSPRELRALATHQLLAVRSGQARFQLAATSLIWGFGWVRWAGEQQRQPDPASGEPASPMRHFIGSIAASIGLPGLPFARGLQRRAAQGRSEASDQSLAEAFPDLRVPMATVLQKVWYEADNRADRLRSPRLALLRPFLLWGSSSGLGRTHAALADRVRALSGQDGLPLATGPLGAALEAAAQAAVVAPDLANLELQGDAPTNGMPPPGERPVREPAVASPVPTDPEAQERRVDPTSRTSPLEARTPVAPARWAAALAAADAQAAGSAAGVEPAVSPADAAAAAAALGLRPAANASSRSTPAIPIAPTPPAAAPAPTPTPIDPPLPVRAARSVSPDLPARFMALPPAPDADSPEGRELARIIGMALPAAAGRMPSGRATPPATPTGPTAAAAVGAASPEASPAPRAAPGGGRRPQRWRRATASLPGADPAGARPGRRGPRPSRGDTAGPSDAASGFGSTSGWHSGFDPTSGFGPLGGFDPHDDTPLPALPPIPPLGAEASDGGTGREPTPQAARPMPRGRADAGAAPAPIRTPSADEPEPDLARVLKAPERAAPVRPQDDPQAPLVRAALGLPPRPTVTAVPAAGTRRPGAAHPGMPPAAAQASPPEVGSRLPADGFAPTEFLVRQGVVAGTSALGEPAALRPGGSNEIPGAFPARAAQAIDPQAGRRMGETARTASASAAMAAADQALARDAAGRLSRLAGRDELRAAILGFMLSTDSSRERAAWKTEVGGTNALARILDDLAAQPREALMPWFGDLIRRASNAPLDERRALVESARRVMTAGGVVKPLDRLRWLTLRHGLGASSRKPLASPAVPPDDHAAFYQANLPSIATFTAFLARMIPVYAADVGIDPIGERWYQAVLQRFIGVGTLPPCRVPDSDSLVHALRALQALSWINRPPLVRAWVGEAIGHAGSAGLAQDAADALFMTCLLLDSPMPGELARYFPTVNAAPASR